MKQYLFILTTFLFFGLRISFGQGDYIPYSYTSAAQLERYELLQGRFTSEIHWSILPLTRKTVSHFTDSILRQNNTHKVDRFNNAYWSTETWDQGDRDSLRSSKPFLKTLYTYPNALFTVREKDFTLMVNPVFNFQVGSSGGNEQANYTYLNTRGIDVRGAIANRVGFYTFFSETQASFANYVNDKVGYYSTDSLNSPIVPYEAFGKNFKQNGYDFITARGYITFELVKKYIHFQFGYDKNFIGHGYRSLILSDQAAPYTFGKLTTKIWKLHYQSIFAQMNGNVGTPGNLYPKKYAAIHYLSIQLGKKVQLGVFESVIFGREDSTKAGTFDISYLNPVLFYRAIEQANGSYDNALLGINFQYLFTKKMSAYGQIVLDEFVLQEVRNRTGWWGNKQGLQIGLKYINVFGIKNLDVQGEVNIVRPYMYAHKDYYTSYTHYNQPLAHPMGANFTEFISIARYQPIPRLHLTGKIILIQWGDDSSHVTNSITQNNGGNIFKSYDPIATANTYDNTIGQGVATSIQLFSLLGSYQVKHNLFLDAQVLIRNQSSDIESKSYSTLWVSTGVRYNIAARQYTF
ncbi:MAG: capsule assembly Wzi family protein [Cytophagaceae bacterium]|jgi:hypothetical protein|nr:capsule assembly Wzi family protein [Cytophagaceae bacterium]